MAGPIISLHMRRRMAVGVKEFNIGNMDWVIFYGFLKRPSAPVVKTITPIIRGSAKPAISPYIFPCRIARRK